MGATSSTLDAIMREFVSSGVILGSDPTLEKSRSPNTTWARETSQRFWGEVSFTLLSEAYPTPILHSSSRGRE